jgi:hypothetical protein
MATQILKCNLEFVLHDARIYVFSVLHMNSGLTFSVVYSLQVRAPSYRSNKSTNYMQ